MKANDEAEVIGRPFGDLPGQGFYLESCSALGTVLTVQNAYDDGSYLLSDGFFYPSTSVRLVSPTQR